MVEIVQSPTPLGVTKFANRLTFAERCHYCGKRVKLAHIGSYDHDDATVDHVMPKSLLASNDVEEVVTACRQCNHMKGSTPPEVYRAYIKLFGYQGLANQRAYRLYCHYLMVTGLQDQASVIEKLQARWPSLRND